MEEETEREPGPRDAAEEFGDWCGVVMRRKVPPPVVRVHSIDAGAPTRNGHFKVAE